MVFGFLSKEGAFKKQDYIFKLINVITTNKEEESEDADLSSDSDDDYE